MRAALFGINIINIGKNVLIIGIAILHCYLYNDAVLFTLQINRLSVNLILILVNKINKLNNTTGKMEGFAATLRALISKGNSNSLIQKC